MPSVRAPELTGAGWIGAAEAVSLAALRGKIVVLHFWASCCVNCERVLAELRPLEDRFADEAVFLGVHTPKFPHEHDHAAIERAVDRLGISHPVLDDRERSTWRSYAVRGWPTVVVVDPDGYVVGGLTGEGCGPAVAESLERLVAAHGVNLRRGRLPLSAPPSGDDRPLRYPAKVAVHPGGRHVAIADTGHGRVLVCDLEGAVEMVVPSLDQPHGVCFASGWLVICDTGADRVVATPDPVHPPDRAIRMAPAGVGNEAPMTMVASLASPWDVTPAGGRLVVAEAARHTLWSVSIDGADGPTRLAGTGEENLIDGSSEAAILAQPSGVAPVAGGVAFVDAESSALRIRRDDGEIATLVGQGLFDWGASDGGPESSALQHPLGVAAGTGGRIYVADTFNSLIRVWQGTELEPGAGTLNTLPISDLDEPGGLGVLPDGRLVIADTNHHRIVFADPLTGALTPLLVDETTVGAAAGVELVAAAGAPLAVPFRLELDRFAVDEGVAHPVRIEVTADPPERLGAGPRRWALDTLAGSLEIVTGTPGAGVLTVTVEVAACDPSGCHALVGRARHRVGVTA